MPIKSMTGFGRGESHASGIRVTVEAGTVNRKQFDARFNLPREIQELEPRLMDAARKRLSRGQLSVTVRIGEDSPGGAPSCLIDSKLAAARIDEVRRLARSLRLPDDLSASTLVELRDALRVDIRNFDSRHLVRHVEKAFAQALAALAKMREAEGRALEQSLEIQMREFQGAVKKIRARAPRVVARYRKALRARLEKAGAACDALDPALAREVALFADRADITEELDRLDSHFKQWDTLIRARQSNGRALDFLCQELFREINTIGSKANDALVTREVIRCKTVLERIREQVQNVE